MGLLWIASNMASWYEVGPSLFSILKGFSMRKRRESNPRELLHSSRFQGGVLVHPDHFHNGYVIASFLKDSRSATELRRINPGRIRTCDKLFDKRFHPTHIVGVEGFEPPHDNLSGCCRNQTWLYPTKTYFVFLTYHLLSSLSTTERTL